MKNIFNGIKPFIVKYEPEILMSMGIAGMVFALVASVKGTIKATRLVDARKEELGVDKLTPKELIKTTWKCYIPAATSTVISLPCIVAGNRVSSKRNAALAAAYAITEASLQEYQEKVKETIGEQKEKEIRDEIVKDRAERANSNQAIVVVNDGDVLFHDKISGRYFKSTWNKIQDAANKLNADALAGYGTITVNDWFSAIGLETTSRTFDDMGWDTANGRSGLIDVSITPHITDDNKPCLEIYYYNEPKVL